MMSRKKMVLELADCLYGFIQQAVIEALNSERGTRKAKHTKMREVARRPAVFTQQAVLHALERAGVGGLTPRELVIAIRGRDFKRDRMRAQVAMISLRHAGLARKAVAKSNKGKYFVVSPAKLPQQKPPITSRIVEVKRKVARPRAWMSVAA